MPWKEGVKVEDVHTFRAIVKAARDLEEKVEGETMTPQEALKELEKFMGANGFQAKKKEDK